MADKNLDLNTSGELPEGSSTQGATRNAMGEAKLADVRRGFYDADYTKSPLPQEDDGTVAFPLDDDWPKTRGFLDRPEGWDR